MSQASNHNFPQPKAKAISVSPVFSCPFYRPPLRQEINTPHPSAVHSENLFVASPQKRGNVDCVWRSRAGSLIWGGGRRRQKAEGRRMKAMAGPLRAFLSAKVLTAAGAFNSPALSSGAVPVASQGSQSCSQLQGGHHLPLGRTAPLWLLPPSPKLRRDMEAPIYGNLR